MKDKSLEILLLLNPVNCRCFSCMRIINKNINRELHYCVDPTYNGKYTNCVICNIANTQYEFVRYMYISKIKERISEIEKLYNNVYRIELVDHRSFEFREENQNG